MTIAEKLQLIAENEQKIYNAGKASSDAYATGKQAQYDEFWDTYQRNGTRMDYNYAFGGMGWTNTIFKPKYDIIPGVGNCGFGIFYYSGLSGDLAKLLEHNGIELNTSQASLLQNLFIGCYNITKVPEINATGATTLRNAFSGCNNLQTIEKLILKSDGSQDLTTSFAYCRSLENITIEGVIGFNGTDFSACTKLSGASLLSIVRALSTTTSGYTITLSKTAVDNAKASDLGQFLTAWENLLANRTNWTINLV